MKFIGTTFQFIALLACQNVFADPIDWYFGLGYNHGTDNKLEKKESKISDEALSESQKQLSNNNENQSFGKQTFELDESKAFTLIAGRQIGRGYSLETQYSYTPKTDFKATTYSSKEPNNYNYVQGNYEAHSISIYGTARKLITNTFYVKGRVGISYSKMKSKLESSTLKTDNDQTKISDIERKNIDDDKFGFAGGLGFGARLTPQTNLEISYETNPIFDGVQTSLVFRF